MLNDTISQIQAVGNSKAKITRILQQIRERTYKLKGT